MREIDELRTMTAGRLLTVWRECRELAEDPLERTLLCNARILAECCFYQNERVFEDEWAVLKELTGRQIEQLLVQLASGEDVTATAVNPGFDRRRFRALQEG